MNSWDTFIYYAAISVICWVAGTIAAFRQKRKTAIVLSVGGSLLFLSFIVVMWSTLGRPPLRTMGETLMATVFIGVNILKPEIHSTTLMPALQSPWFVPHVIVYMFSYAMMGAATIFAIYLWMRKTPAEVSDNELAVCDGLVRVGWVFLTLGMTMGALWAKEAWGDYWTWDPKETWAFATWLSYLLYLHLRPANRDANTLFALLVFSFILLQMCWWGINFLPSAKGASIHVY